MIRRETSGSTRHEPRVAHGPARLARLAARFERALQAVSLRGEPGTWGAAVFRLTQAWNRHRHGRVRPADHTRAAGGSAASLAPAIAATDPTSSSSADDRDAHHDAPTRDGGEDEALDAQVIEGLRRLVLRMVATGALDPERARQILRGVSRNDATPAREAEDRIVSGVWPS